MFGTSFHLTLLLSVLVCSMAKKQAKQLSPSELAKYTPEDPIPKLQAQATFGLESTFELAKQSGVSIIGEIITPTQIPQIKK